VEKVQTWYFQDLSKTTVKQTMTAMATKASGMVLKVTTGFGETIRVYPSPSPQGWWFDGGG